VVRSHAWSLAIPVGDGLGDDADVGDAGLAEGVDDGAESAEGNGFIGAEVDGVVGVLGLLSDFVGELVNINRIVAEIDALVFVDGDDELLFGDFLDGVGFGNVDFNAGLEDGSGDHKDDKEDEDHVDERNHVDIGEAGLGGFGHGGHGWSLRDFGGGYGYLSATMYQEAKRKKLTQREERRGRGEEK
jgi:hypothetical protein